jgi:pilus assembly protein CpaB
MDRRARTFLVLIIALATASVAAYSIYRLIERMPVRTVEVATYEVVVAAKPLTLGASLTRDDVKLVPWPAKNQVGGGFTNVDDVIDRGLLTNIDENEPITVTKVAAKEAGAGLPPMIPEGMRALSIKVNEVIGVAGFVLPGSHVDVIVTIAEGSSQSSITRVVVSDVLVLTAGTRYDQQQSRQGQAMPSSVVTLQVTPEDAEKITLAGTEGTLMLTLRNPLDTAPTVTKGVRKAALMGEPAPPPVVKNVGTRRVVARPPADPKPQQPVVQPYIVETFRGGERKTEEVVR